MEGERTFNKRITVKVKLKIIGRIGNVPSTEKTSFAFYILTVRGV